jgi:hypothetical protein
MMPHIGTDGQIDDESRKEESRVSKSERQMRNVQESAKEMHTDIATYDCSNKQKLPSSQSSST